MKKTIFTFLLAIFVAGAFAQNQLVKELEVTVYTSSFEKSKASIKQFVADKKAVILSEYETVKDFEIKFYLNESEFQDLDKLLPEIGYVERRELETNNYNEKIEKIKIERKYLSDRKTAYEKELANMTEKNNRYYQYWEEVRYIDKKVFELDTELKELESKNLYKVKISLYDETVDLTDRTINWVNMPGASFDMLFVENPVSSLSAQQYMGYSLKYMFTRGKSYAYLGGLKEFSPEVADDTRYKELFTFGFGQDFYSRYFGRGKNRFLNLYTGYNLGGMFATSETTFKFIFHMTPFFGIELFKNKYVLLDTRVGYFVPFAHNRNMRGIYTTASFNFVF